jgi:hypothetical protein
MAVYTFSAPDKDKEKVDKIFEEMKRRHLNKSSVIRQLLVKYAEEKGLIDAESK